MAPLAIITGGARGIGRAIARQWLAADASRVAVIVDRLDREDALRTQGPDETANRASYVQCDVRDRGAFEAVFNETTTKHHNKLELVVNNAGVGAAGFDDLDACLDVNLGAVARGTHHALDAFQRQRTEGVVINVASLAGLVPAAHMPVYSAAKHGVVGLVRSLHRVAKRDRDVRVYALCPSFADTALVADHLRLNNADQEGTRDDHDHDHDPGQTARRRAARALARHVAAQGGLMTPDFVADAAMRLLADDRAGTAHPVMFVTPQTGARYQRDFPHDAETALLPPLHRVANGLARLRHLIRTL